MAERKAEEMDTSSVQCGYRTWLGPEPAMPEPVAPQEWKMGEFRHAHNYSLSFIFVTFLVSCLCVHDLGFPHTLNLIFVNSLMNVERTWVISIFVYSTYTLKWALQRMRMWMVSLKMKVSSFTGENSIKRVLIAQILSYIWQSTVFLHVFMM